MLLLLLLLLLLLQLLLLLLLLLLQLLDLGQREWKVVAEGSPENEGVNWKVSDLRQDWWNLGSPEKQKSNKNIKSNAKAMTNMTLCDILVITEQIFCRVRSQLFKYFLSFFHCDH